MNRKPWQNASGCNDPTAYRGDTAISKEEERVGELVKVLKYIIHLAGFELVERINLRERKTGRTYR